jgi:hypothetical protein
VRFRVPDGPAASWQMPSRAAASPSPAQTRRLARLPSRRCRASRRSWVIDRPSARWFGLVDLEPGDRVWSCGQPSSWSMRQVLSAASPVRSVRHGQCQRRSLPRGDGPGLARAAVTVTVDLLAAAATHRPPPRTWRFGWWRRVPMLYGTRRGSRPALLPRVSGVTWAFVTRQEALDRLGEPRCRDSDLRASRAGHTLDRNEPAWLDVDLAPTARLTPETLWKHTAPRRATPTTTRHGNPVASHHH